MNNKSENKIVVPVEQFAKMTSKQIVELMNKNKNYQIIGEQSGVDRMIIEKIK